jgi:hypothetical protein
MAKPKKITLDDAQTLPVEDARALLTDASPLDEVTGEVTVYAGHLHLPEGDLALEGAVVVTGDLVLKKGDVLDLDTGGGALVVGGKLKARNLIVESSAVTVSGPTALKVALFARRDAALTFHGDVDAKGIVLADVEPRFGARLRAPVFDHLRDDNPVADYGADADLKTYCSRDILVGGAVDHAALLARIRTYGKAPLTSNANPARVIAERAIKKRVDKGEPVTEFVLETDGYAASGKKMRYLPETITDLTELEVLNIKGHYVRAIPDAIGNLTNLRELNLYGNEIADFSPEFANLTRLERLNLSYVRNPIPRLVGELPSLKWLRIWGGIPAHLPADLGPFPALEELDLSFGYPGDYGEPYPIDCPGWIFEVKTLRRLKLSGVPMRALPEAILGLERLESLDMTAALMYLDELPDLSQLPNLRELYFDGRVGWNMFPAPPARLARVIPDITTLERLRMDSWDGLALEDDFFAKMKGLKWLDVAFHKWTSLPESLFSVDALEYIDLRYVPIGAPQLARLEETFPGIEIRR